MDQSATTALAWTPLFRAGASPIPTTLSRNKAITKSSQNPIKMRVRAISANGNCGLFANKATQVIENKRPDFARYELTHCENGKNPVKMRARAQRIEKKNSFFKVFHRLMVCNPLKIWINQKFKIASIHKQSQSGPPKTHLTY